MHIKEHIEFCHLGYLIYFRLGGKEKLWGLLDSKLKYGAEKQIIQKDLGFKLTLISFATLGSVYW